MVLATNVINCHDKQVKSDRVRGPFLTLGVDTAAQMKACASAWSNKTVKCFSFLMLRGDLTGIRTQSNFRLQLCREHHNIRTSKSHSIHYVGTRSRSLAQRSVPLHRGKRPCDTHAIRIDLVLPNGMATETQLPYRNRNLDVHPAVRNLSEPSPIPVTSLHGNIRVF
jgi:hypothetical protein